MVIDRLIMTAVSLHCEASEVSTRVTVAYFLSLEPIQYHKELRGLILLLFPELLTSLMSHILTKFILWAENVAHKQICYSQ
jgi:hypothetical protein